MSDDDLPRPRIDPRLRAPNVRRPIEEPLIAEAPARTRTNPRAELAGRRTRGAIEPDIPVAEASAPQRRNPRDRLAGRPGRGGAAEARDEAIQRIEQPAGYVMAVLDLDGGALARGDRDLLGACRALADELGLAVAALVCGGAAETVVIDAGKWGADRVVHLADPALAAGLPVQRVDPIVAAAAMLEARHVLFNDSALGGELGRRVAARLGDRPVVNAIKLAAESVTYLGDAGRNEISGALPRVILLRPDSFDAIACEPRREARIVAGPTVATPLAQDDMGLLPVEPAHLPLDEADLIVSAGNGVSDWEGFHDLAQALGAAEGGSRVVVDAGHMPRHRQIGASGLIVAPRCYIALGISGASQHLDGIVDCPRVVAVNYDPHADMIKRADLAVIGDVQAIMPALARQARGQA